MATTDEIASLREKIDQPENVAPWTDERLAALIDGVGLRAAAADIWETKAAKVAKLMDVSEGGSSRAMSKIYKQYLEFADRFKAEEETPASRVRSSRTRAITRV